MPKSVSVLFEDVDEDFYDERRGNCGVKLKIRDEGGFERLSKTSLRGIIPITALNSHTSGRSINTHQQSHNIKFG
jgi:hypothetical protein